MDDPERFFANTGSVLSTLAAVLQSAAALHGVAGARGWDQWQDADLQAIGRTRNDLLAVLYLLDDLKSFANNGQVAQADRQNVIDKFRGDL